MDAVLAIFVNERFVWGCSHPHNFVSSLPPWLSFPSDDGGQCDLCDHHCSHFGHKLRHIIWRNERFAFFWLF